MDGIDDVYEPGFDQSFAGVSISASAMDGGPSLAMGLPLDNGQGLVGNQQRAFAVDCEFIQVWAEGEHARRDLDN